MNKNILATFAFAVPLLLMGAGCATQTSTSITPVTTPTTTSTVTTQTNGKVVISLTDAALDMGDITGIALTENKIELHNEVSGWITASSATKTFNLLELKAKKESALVAIADVPAGTYDKVRISVVKILITTKDGTIVEAKVPSHSFTINIEVIVEANATTSINLDMLADASLHRTGNGTYIFTPVIKIENRTKTTVKIDADNKVRVAGGDMVNETTHGMDINGEIKLNFKFDENRQFDLDVKGNIK